MLRTIKNLLLFICFLSLGNCKEKTKTEIASTNVEVDRPNILVVMCDDLGYSDVGFNGAKDITTPEIDKLAFNGTIMTSGYVSHPFCGPSRAGLMTGKYPHTLGAQFNLPANSEVTVGKGVSLKETFISTVLHDAGYYTGAIGKWHLGPEPAYHPNRRGFDYYHGFLGGGHNYFPEQYTAAYNRQREQGKKVIFDYLKPLDYNGEEVKNPTEYLTDELSHKAVEFVDNASKRKNPFFLFLAYNAPHVPLEAKAEDLEKFKDIKDENRRTYAAMVYAVDRGVGEIVTALKENGQFDNTLIVFLSDNGGKVTKGATNFPLREGKGSTCEGGYRVPMFFHWPGKVASGQKFSYPVSALDFYPTFANLAQAEIPEGKELNGKDIWPAFSTGKNPRKGEMVFVLRHREGYSDVGVRQDQWKALKTNQNTWKLFNIDEDMGEENDLSDQYPEQLAQMVAGAREWSKSHAEPQWFDPEELREIWKEKDMAKFNGTFDLEQGND
ncbi:sulfatase-like hydrolase/transferase [Maribacter sp. TH_r10]|uniref:sulfatase-like hydrolase/transferase n=1 Tax=Maribacter sp. TH_r10 TaxID=3082086 RepID=UPI0029532341|nr:sulfatase-like hydrolase/transferase [Maribacter sp. TH_r10]MDV7139049.1 sulfatase-like hydrolase/transferase [Maribacter sp. TH_r10]